jgi:hypothetical protein
LELLLLLVVEIEVMSKALQFGCDLFAYFSSDRHGYSPLTVADEVEYRRLSSFEVSGFSVSCWA